jgi:hypothetical protein
VPYAGYDLGIKKEVSLIYYNGKGRMLKYGHCGD